jgi:hypothetical protein
LKPTEQEVNAVIAQESSGEMYFDSYENRQYRLNCRKVREHITDEVELNKAFKHLNKIEGNSLHVAKFRFSPARWKEINSDKNLAQLDISVRFLLSCSIGLGQKIMLYLYKEVLKEGHSSAKALDTCLKFVHNRESQVNQVYKDLEYWFTQSKGDKLLGFSMYNAGFVKEHNTYGLEILERLKNVPKKPTDTNRTNPK